jgi:hypothetical protein
MQQIPGGEKKSKPWQLLLTERNWGLWQSIIRMMQPQSTLLKRMHLIGSFSPEKSDWACLPVLSMPA